MPSQTTALILSCLLVVVASTANITVSEVTAAQQAWGNALVSISTTYDNQGFAAAKALAETVIDSAYAYNTNGQVLFKPTLTYGNQTFRLSRAGALAYFVGGDPNYPNDNGFAFKSWRGFQIQNAAIFLEGNTGTTMGNVILTDVNGAQTKVDKTWTFLKGADGQLRIVLHHSSLPYSPVPLSAAAVTLDDVVAAQQAWGQALVNISTVYDTSGFAAAKAVAEAVLDAAYSYDSNNTVFKPTLTFGNQTFRLTRAGALAYFVGGDPNFPNDTGFALKSWRNVQIQNAAILLEGNSGTSMGNVIITDKNGNSVTVDKTWRFVRGSDGKLRITIHHSSLPYTPSSVASPSKVTADEVRAAQRAWGDALVNISTTYDQQGFAAAQALAGQVIDAAYNYQNGEVLFKPTLTYGNQTFRTTRAGALAYFVGGDANYPNDNGFAFKSWRKVEIKNAAIYLNGNQGTSMGNVILTDINGAQTMVDKTWSFVKGSDGTLRIVLHHSSLPYSPVSASPSPPSCPQNISEDEIKAAQEAWGNALISISTTYDNQGLAAAKTLAGQIIDAAYNYQNADVLFKPTLTFGNQTFRTSRAGALAYFVGDDVNYPNDKGFALKSWRKAEIKNAALFVDCNTGASMGNVILTDVNGAVTMVDKTWLFAKGTDGVLRIALHHSSLPYKPSSSASSASALTSSSGSDYSKAEQTFALGIGLSCAVIVVINVSGVAFICYVLYKLQKSMETTVQKQGQLLKEREHLSSQTTAKVEAPIENKTTSVVSVEPVSAKPDLKFDCADSADILNVSESELRPTAVQAGSSPKKVMLL
jgi:hypothetical protein